MSDYSRPIVDLQHNLRELHLALLDKRPVEARKLTDTMLADLYVIRDYISRMPTQNGQEPTQAGYFAHFPPY